MMKKVIAAVILIGVVAAVTVIATKTTTSSELSLTQKHLVEGPGFVIEKERFEFYKANVIMANELQHQGQVPSDRELLDVLIKNELAIQDAKKKGITVTSEEVEDVIQFQRTTLESPNYEGDNKELVQNLMENRIKATGLTKDEFWASQETKKYYEKALYVSNLYKYLTRETEIGTLEQFEIYKDELLSNAQALLKINL